MDEREIRRIFRGVLEEDEITREDALKASSEIHRIIEGAEDHGFNKAEAIKAILGRVLSDKHRGCNCHSCRMRLKSN